MRIAYSKILLILFLSAGQFPETYAGGISIDKGSVLFNGYPCGSVFSSGSTVSMGYRVNHFAFSGNENNRYCYFVFRIMNQRTRKEFFVLQIAERYDRTFELIFDLPYDEGEYQISYSGFPLYHPSAIGRLYRETVIIDTSNYRERVTVSPIITRHINESGSLNTLCSIFIDNRRPSQRLSPTLYLKLNDRLPTDVNLQKVDKEFKFSWTARYIHVEAKPLFRYKLDPDEDWSDWQTETSASYYLIPKGVHEFLAECKYEYKGAFTTTNATRFSFTLNSSFFGQPDISEDYRPGDTLYYIDKGEIKRGTDKPTEITGNVYDKSMALVIGVDKYSDRSFPPLPYVREDVAAVRETFSALGFETKSSDNGSKTQIMSAIRTALNSLNKNDRLVIYISAHGFLDPISLSPLLAASDCKKNEAANAISIDEIKTLMKAPGIRGKHILLILDCCTSGIALVEKAAPIKAIRSLATRHGTHIITAGMSDQNVRMYESLRKSVFTHYLTTGLRTKAADYTKDGIITLSELLIYVQYNVANYTQGAQIPMFGRVSGIGEIIF